MTPTSPSSSAPPAAPTAPKAPIQQALESLVINLDEELMRYRQSRAGEAGPPPSQHQTTFRKRRKSVDFITMTKAAPGAAASTQVAAGLQTPGPRTRAAAAPSSQAARIATPPVPPPRAGRLAAAVSSPGTGVTGTTALAVQGGAMTAYRDLPDDYLATTEMLLNSGAYADAEVAGSRTDAYEDPNYRPSLRQQLMTPLGIGSLLLLLLASASFGYLVTSPEAVSHLARLPLVQGLRGGNQETESDPTAVDPSDLSVAEPDSEAPISGLNGIGPDLSEDEFKDLDLSRLSTLPSDTNSAQVQADLPLEPPLEASSATADRQPAPQEATTPRSINSDAAASAPVRTDPGTVTAPNRVVASTPRSAPPQAPQAAARPAPSTAAPAAPSQPPQPLQPMAAARPAPPQPLPPSPVTPATPSQAPPAPISQAASAASPNYYVVTDYTGDQSLAAARGVVGDAYVRNFPAGAKIQMGAFSQATSAQSLVQQLQSQGIAAQVYTP